MEIHYFNHEASTPAVGDFLLRSSPPGIPTVEHYSSLWATGRYNQDNQPELAVERTRRIVATIKARLDGELMLWVEPGTLFLAPLFEIASLSRGLDLLLPGEQTKGASGARFEVQAIRRTADSLIFFSRLLLLQIITGDPQPQEWSSNLLEMEDAPRWGFFPVGFICTSLEQLHPHASVFHACLSKTGTHAVQCEMMTEALERMKKLQ